MTKLNYLIFFTLFIGLMSSTFANTLYDLDKIHFENQTLRQDLANDVENTKNKIQLNQAAIRERKQDLVQFIRADRQLNKFQFGGAMAAENRQLLNRNLNIFEKIKEKNLSILRELKYYSEDLDREQKSLTEKIRDLAVAEKKLLNDETKLVAQEKDSLQKILAEKKDSLLIHKGQLSPPIAGENANIKYDFGSEFGGKNQYSVNHRGITYTSTLGQNVQAVGPGKIIFRDHIKYWGESVIVQHAGDYYSVYTNLKHCRIELNQTVSQSEKIGETASPEFYFELRNQNVAIDPKKWIRN